MSMPASAGGGWTVAMLETLPDDGNRYEIIDGELFVTPAPSYTHQRIVLELALLFGTYLRGSREAEVMIAPADVRAGDRTSVEPDLFVIPLVNGRPLAGPAKLGELLLAIEVLSPSTAGLDRYKKRPTYQREGVREYWIVDPDAHFIERWRPRVDEPEIVRGMIDWRAPGAAEALEIDLELLFARVSER
jgi:Uma2 family endonuclease